MLFTKDLFLKVNILTVYNRFLNQVTQAIEIHLLSVSPCASNEPILILWKLFQFFLIFWSNFRCRFLRKWSDNREFEFILQVFSQNALPQWLIFVKPQSDNMVYLFNVQSIQIDDLELVVDLRWISWGPWQWIRVVHVHVQMLFSASQIFFYSGGDI